MASSYLTTIDAKSGLVASWRLSSSVGGYLPNAQGVTSRDLAVYGTPSFVPGLITDGGGYAMDSNGSQSYGGFVDAAMDITGDITIVAWIKPKTISGSQYILSYGSGGTPYALYTLGANIFAACKPGGSPDTTASSSNPLSVGNIYMLAFVRDDTEKKMRVFVNGQNVTQYGPMANGYSGAVSSDTSGDGFVVACSQASPPSNRANIIIDEIAILNRAMAVDGTNTFCQELVDLYNEGIAADPVATPTTVRRYSRIGKRRGVRI